jgi:hypothetical protein
VRPGRRRRAFAIRGCDNLAMKMMWRWRCKSEVPMLDDEEFQSITSLRYKGEGEILRERMFSALLREYERVTGFHETNPNAIYHHKLSLWPCLLQVRETFAHAQCESMRIVHASC